METEIKSTTDALQELINQAHFAKSCCNSPNDRMWHSADNTWWKRVGNKWVAADTQDSFPKMPLPTSTGSPMDYAISLQQAIEYHCNGMEIPESIANLCPHHARKLNARLNFKEREVRHSRSTNMKTETATPLTDQAEQLYQERSAAYAVRDLCRKLEQTSINRNEAKLVTDLIKLWHAAWEDGNCKRDCQCAKCNAFEEAGNHDKATFDSLTEKASAAMSNASDQRPGPR
jgi:hypothetical protein